MRIALVPAANAAAGDVVTAQAPSSYEPLKQNSPCDPNSGACVPIASDVDCEGSGGNGPAYVQGPVTALSAVTVGRMWAVTPVKAAEASLDRWLNHSRNRV